MAETTGRVEEDSYDRGHELYRKRLQRWRRLEFTGGTAFGFGVAAVCAPFNPYTYGLEGAALIATMLIGVVLLAAGAPVFGVAKSRIRRNKLDDFVYRIAVHFMSEMGIDQPEKVLDQNPRYLEAFEEVRSAVTAVEASNAGIRKGSMSLTPRSRRIGSLVLRDERSLGLTPQLVSLIKDQMILDYDLLAARLDGI
ncbi:hypothetical protein [Pseudarthrobacter sp. BIM B-2242]|uniref:hypothetical protein n=1 Tax=Pseudarthrobacter sp. BIM B-2242 TaxID=2772401 RepID=UPI00168BDD86|nr:hypothetical protein [Pseudarthrobacter sp. BIM B-2242]QOD05863.1 hypothetical protein IDT60_23010 [Pseudarthrobacter sp. BIM B-2242]